MAGRDHVHFGHKSFREFLVARYWADRLRKLAQGRDLDWDERARDLVGARLLVKEERSFAYLRQILRASSERKASPLAWTPELRMRVREWAERCFNNENQQFASSNESTRLWDDQRALMREAALAIGSAISVIDHQPGLKASPFKVPREPLRCGVYEQWRRGAGQPNEEHSLACAWFWACADACDTCGAWHRQQCQGAGA